MASVIVQVMLSALILYLSCCSVGSGVLGLLDVFVGEVALDVTILFVVAVALVELVEIGTFDVFEDSVLISVLATVVIGKIPLGGLYFALFAHETAENNIATTIIADNTLFFINISNLFVNLCYKKVFLSPSRSFAAACVCAVTETPPMMRAISVTRSS